MMIGSKQITVRVHDENCTVHLYQKSKTIWLADGYYMGTSVEGKGATQSQARDSWKRIAERVDD
jgi:hypothetical protein